MTSSSVSSGGGAKIGEMDGKGGRCVWEVLNCDSTGRRVAAELVYMSRCNSVRSTCTRSGLRHADMGAARKRKANKYLLTQQKCSPAVHWWKQKAEDEERRARKPAGCMAPRLCPRAKQGEDRREDSGGEGREERECKGEQRKDLRDEKGVDRESS